MATKTWLGNDSGNEGNLSTNANWSPSGVPTNGDDIIFDASGQAITAGYTALASVTADTIQILAGANYAFGTAADFVQMQATNGTFVYSTAISGGIHLSNASARQLNIVNGPRVAGQLSASGALDLSNLGLQSGHLTVLADPDVGTHGRATSIAAGALVGPNGTLDVAASVTLNGGTVAGRLESVVNTGAWTVPQGGYAEVSGTATSAWTISGGTVRHAGTGNVTALTGTGAGRFSHAGDSAYALGSSSQVVVEGGFTLDPGARATVTNGVKVTTAGRPIVLPPGATATLTMPGA